MDAWCLKAMNSALAVDPYVVREELSGNLPACHCENVGLRDQGCVVRCGARASWDPRRCRLGKRCRLLARSHGGGKAHAVAEGLELVQEVVGAAHFVDALLGEVRAEVGGDGTRLGE